MAEKAVKSLEKNLLIVESPAKAKTIGRYLGEGFIVKASIGHIVDLPKKTLGVKIDHDFEPEYQVMPEKKKVAKEIEDAAKKADRIFLAPDPDREGEAIAWHIANLVAKAHKPVKRVLINEITKQAVKDAIANAGELDQNRFEAQQARRILDRLVGYQISPLLWRKISTGLSAGRVQSVAVRIICEREREIQKFITEEYWTLEGLFKAALPPEFPAKLFEISGEKKRIPDSAAADAIEKELLGLDYIVGKVDKRNARNARPSRSSPRAFSRSHETFRVPRPAHHGHRPAALRRRGTRPGRTGRPDHLHAHRLRARFRRGHRGARAPRLRSCSATSILPAKPNVYKSKKEAQDSTRGDPTDHDLTTRPKASNNSSRPSSKNFTR